jgi:MT-A70
VEARRRLGLRTVPAILRTMSDLDAELGMIDENLCRHDLSPAERAIAVRRRKAVYLQLHPDTAHGAIGNGRDKSRQLGDSTSDNEINRFTRATAEATGIGERTLQRDAARGEKLGDDTLKKVVGTSLDKGEELDALAKLSDKRRESLVERAVAGEAVTAKPEVKREVRDAREVELGRKIADGNLAAPDKTYGIILADWPRKPRVWSEETGFDRAPDNHYATQTFRWAIDELAPMIQRLAASDAMLVMWTTPASLIDDIEIMAEAGFCALRPRQPDGRLAHDENGEPLDAVSPGGGTYRSHQVWDKELRGMGRWFIDRHELVLIGVRGNIPCPAPGTQALSLFTARRGEPSVKPDFVADEIDRLWPNLPKIELIARRARPGWDRWGRSPSRRWDDRGCHRGGCDDAANPASPRHFVGAIRFAGRRGRRVDPSELPPSRACEMRHRRCRVKTEAVPPIPSANLSSADSPAAPTCARAVLAAALKGVAPSPAAAVEIADRAGADMRGHIFRARAGKPINAGAFLAICGALGIDPVDGSTRPPRAVPACIAWPLVGAGLRIVRRHQGQRSAAKTIGISAATLCRVEAGDAVSVETLLAVCAFIGTHPEHYAS